IGNGSKKLLATTVAAVSVPLALGPILGPVIGGIILNAASWRWIFLINVPLVGIGLLLAWRLIAPDAPGQGSRPAERVDVLGLALLAPALVGIVRGLSYVASDGGAGGGDGDVWRGSGAVVLGGGVHRA